jgi:hypothetical protein
MFTLTAVLIAACAPAPTPTPPLPVHVTVTPALVPSLSPATASSTPTAQPFTPTNAPPTAAPPTEESRQMSDKMKIRITVEGSTELTATLIDSKTTQDFIALLPLTITLEDYGGTEKISYLPEKLSTRGAPEGIDPSVGDITYYAPWGNLAIFHRDFVYSNGLVLLGSIDGDIAALSVSGPINVKIELVK